MGQVLLLTTPPFFSGPQTMTMVQKNLVRASTPFLSFLAAFTQRSPPPAPATTLLRPPSGLGPWRECCVPHGWLRTLPAYDEPSIDHANGHVLMVPVVSAGLCHANRMWEGNPGAGSITVLTFSSPRHPPAVGIGTRPMLTDGPTELSTTRA